MDKFIIGLILLISLLSSLAPAYALTYGNLEVRLIKDITDYPTVVEEHLGNPIFYTPQCFDCHLPLMFRWNGADFTLQKSELKTYKTRIAGLDDITGIGINYLDNETYQDWVSNVVCVNGTALGNGTIPQTCSDNGYYVAKWRAVWKAVPTTIPIKTGKWYIIDIYGHRKSGLISAAVDIVPEIKGVQLPEYAWWDASWLYRKNSTIKSSVSTDEILPRNITLNTYALITAGHLQSDCDDLRMANESDLEIPFYIEGSCGTDSANTNTTLWYKTTTDSSNTSLIWVYYGNPSATNGQNKNGVFDTDTKVAYGMGEGTGTNLDDGTSNNNDATLTSGGWTNGFFNNASAYNGASSYAKSGSTIASGETAITMETWVYITNYTQYGGIGGKSTTSKFFALIQSSSLGCPGTNNYIGVSRNTVPGEFYTCVGEAPTGRWIYLVERFNGTYTDVFLNGTLKGSTQITGTFATETDYILLMRQNSATYSVGGYMARFIYSAVSRTNNYIKMVYDTATKSSLTTAWGTEEVGTSATVNLTIDGGVGNITVEYSSTAGHNITAWSSDPTYWVAILRNGTAIANGTGSASITSVLAASLYNITVVNNISAKSTLWMNITKQATWCDLLLLPPSPLTYPYPVIALCMCYGMNDLNNTATLLYRNGINRNSTENYAETVIPAGLHNYTCNTTGDANYTANTSSDSMTMNQADNPVILNLTLGNSSQYINSGIVYYYPMQIKATATGLLAKLYRANCSLNPCTYTDITSENDTWDLRPVNQPEPLDWRWSYLVNSSGNQNYSSNTTYWANSTNRNDIPTAVFQGTPAINITFNTSDSVIQGTPVLVTCNKPSEISVSLYNSTTNIGNPYVFDTTGKTGVFTYVCNTTGNSNYTSANISKNLTVNLAGGLMIDAVLDENSLAPLQFNLTIYNATFSSMVNNIYSYNNNTVQGSLILAITSSGYIARNYYVTMTSNDSVNITGYLLKNTEGVYPSYWTYSNSNPTGEPEVLVDVTRFIGTQWVSVEQDMSDFEGKGTLYLSPYAVYRINASKDTRYVYISSYSANPSIIIKLNLEGNVNATNITWLFTNIRYSLMPTDIYVRNSSNNLTLINYTISSSDSLLEWYGMNITLQSGVNIYSQNTSSSTGGTLTVNFNMTGREGTTFTAKTWFKKAGQPMFYWTRTYIVVEHHSYIPTAVAGITSVLGLSEFIGNLIAMFVSLAGSSSIKNTMGQSGSSIVYMGILAVFVFLGFFNWLIFLNLAIVGLLLIAGSKYI